ncbi:MAG: pitrilysin family protein [Calditrichia bacterium]
MKRWIAWCLPVVLVASMSMHLRADDAQIHKKELKNGLDVIVIENPVVPLVTIEIDVKNGAYTETPEYDGLSHLYEHMFFKANKNIPNQEAYMKRLRELGAVWNGTTSEERVNYFFTVMKDSLEPGLVFMKNAITGPLFLKEEMVNERPVVTGEYDRAESNPYFLLDREVNKKVWYKYYSHKNVIGDRDIILNATPEKMQTIQNRFYIPNNSALILAGDITAEEGYKLAEKYFGDWKKRPDPFKAYKVPEHPPIPKTETVVVEHPVNAVTMMIRWQGPSVLQNEKATYAADVLSYILGQQTSKFYKNIVESGLAYMVNFGYFTLNHTGPITVMAQTSPEKFEECKQAIFDELNRMTQPDYFTDEQLENAKTILSINEQYSREKPSQFAHTVGFWWAVADLDYYTDYLKNLDKVNRKDIQDFLKTYVIGEPHIIGVLVSPQARDQINL